MPFVAYDKDYPRPVPHFLKALLDANLWISSYQDEIAFTLASSPDYSLFFGEISTIRLNAPMQQTVSPFATGHPQSRAKALFPALKTTECEHVTGDSVLKGFEFQFLLTWAGIANISKFMISAEASREVKRFGCDYTPTPLIGDLPDDFDYDIEA
jgi:hypothetical protein